MNEPITYYIILIFGGTFLVLYLLAAFNSKRFGMKYIISKSFPIKIIADSFQIHIILFDQNVIAFIAAIWFFVSLFAFVGIIFGMNFYLNMVLVLIAVTCGNCGGILSAISGDLFPTHLK